MQRRDDSAWRIALPILLAILVADVVTKWLAVKSLAVYGPSKQVIGDAVRFSLVYNRGAAFGLSLGPYSRWLFMALTLGALVILWRLFRQTAPAQKARIVAISMVAAGAIGNLIDRIRSERGVVDFIDVGIPTWRWPTFNVADMAVSCGAFLLAFVLWGEENEAERTARATKLASPDGAKSA
jgi:signal peptidase II